MNRNANINSDNNNVITPDASGLTYTLSVATVVAFSLVFSVMIKLFGLDETSDVYIYLSYVIPSLCLAAAIVVNTFVFKKTPVKKLLGFYDFSFKKRYYFVAIAGTVGILMGLGELNNLFISFLKTFGYVASKSPIPEFSPLSLTLMILFVAIIPPILEETVFRGMIQSGIEKSGYKSIFIVAALFSLYHLSPAKTVYQFAVGVLLSLIAYRSGSIIPSLIIHVLNNLIIILNEYFSILSFVFENRIIATAAGLILLIAAVVVTLTDKSKRHAEKESARTLSEFFKSCFVGVVLAAILWVVSLVA